MDLRIFLVAVAVAVAVGVMVWSDEHLPPPGGDQSAEQAQVALPAVTSPSNSEEMHTVGQPPAPMFSEYELIDASRAILTLDIGESVSADDWSPSTSSEDLDMGVLIDADAEPAGDPNHPWPTPIDIGEWTDADTTDARGSVNAGSEPVEIGLPLDADLFWDDPGAARATIDIGPPMEVLGSASWP